MATIGKESADEILAANLAAGRNVRDAAAAAGMSERTAHRRTEEPAFQCRVRELRERHVTDALTKLEGSMGLAADTLAGLLTHADAHVRIRAAVEVLRQALRVRETADLAERIRRLESHLAPEVRQ